MHRRDFDGESRNTGGGITKTGDQHLPFFLYSAVLNSSVRAADKHARQEDNFFKIVGAAHQKKYLSDIRMKKPLSFLLKAQTP